MVISRLLPKDNKRTRALRLPASSVPAGLQLAAELLAVVVVRALRELRTWDERETSWTHQVDAGRALQVAVVLASQRALVRV